MLGKPLPAFPKSFFRTSVRFCGAPQLLQPQTEGFGFQNLNNQDCLCNIAVVAQSVRSEQE